MVMDYFALSTVSVGVFARQETIRVQKLPNCPFMEKLLENALSGETCLVTLLHNG